MSACRVYREPPWSVMVTHADTQPTVVEQLVIRCTQGGCGEVCRWPQDGPMALSITHHHAASLLASFMVCPCTPRMFQLYNGVCPPWCTKEEKVAWLLQG